MAAVYSDFLFRAIGRDIGKEHLQTQWGPVRLERQLGTIWPAEATGEPALPARFIPSTFVIHTKSR
jgi:hypothetical protein